MIDQGRPTKQSDDTARQQQKDRVLSRMGRKRYFALGVLVGVGLLAAGAIVTLLMAPRTGSLGGQSSPTTVGLQQPALPPHPPTAFAASGGFNSILLSWQPPVPAPVGYRIYRAVGPGPYTIVGEVNAPNIDTFTDDVDIVPGETYSYTATAFNRDGESAPVGPRVVLVIAPPKATATLPPAKPAPTFAPPAPLTLTAVAHGTPAPTTPIPTSRSLAGGPGTGTPPSATVAPVATLPTVKVPTASSAPAPIP